ncbi:MAG: S-layer protein domain-containing protein, partial [Methanosarcinales archaeon]
MKIPRDAKGSKLVIINLNLDDPPLRECDQKVQLSIEVRRPFQEKFKVGDLLLNSEIMDGGRTIVGPDPDPKPWDRCRDNTLILKEGYMLTVEEISPDGDFANISLSKNGVVVLKQMIQDGHWFYYNITKDNQTYTIFSAKLDGIFRGTESDVIQLKPFYQYSDGSSETGVLINEHIKLYEKESLDLQDGYAIKAKTIDEKKAWIVLSKNGSEIYGEVVQVGKWFAYGANKSKIGIVNVKLSNISKRQKRYVFDLVVYQTAGEFYKPEKVYVIDRRYHHLGSGSKKLVSKVESWNLSNEYTLTAKIIDKSSDATLNNESTFEDAGILLVGELFDKEVWLILEKNASKISENIQWVYDSRVKGYIIKGLKIGDFYVKIYVDIDMEAFNFEVGSINPIWNNPIPESTEYAKQFDLYGLEAHQAYLSMKVSGVRPTDADYV